MGPRQVPERVGLHQRQRGRRLRLPALFGGQRGRHRDSQRAVWQHRHLGRQQPGGALPNPRNRPLLWPAPHLGRQQYPGPAQQLQPGRRHCRHAQHHRLAIQLLGPLRHRHGAHQLRPLRSAGQRAELHGLFVLRAHVYPGPARRDAGLAATQLPPAAYHAGQPAGHGHQRRLRGRGLRAGGSVPALGPDGVRRLHRHFHRLLLQRPPAGRGHHLRLAISGRHAQHLHPAQPSGELPHGRHFRRGPDRDRA